jgi:hypothetical protein
MGDFVLPSAAVEQNWHTCITSPLSVGYSGLTFANSLQGHAIVESLGWDGKKSMTALQSPMFEYPEALALSLGYPHPTFWGKSPQNAA